MNIIKNIRHTGIVVKNLPKAIKFFTQILGFKVLKKADETGNFIDKILNLKKAELITVKLIAPDGNVLELLKFKNYKDNKLKNFKNIYSYGYTHMSFTVKNINQTYKVLKNQKYKLFSKPQIAPDKKAKVMFCKGPEYIYLEFVEVLKK